MTGKDAYRACPNSCYLAGRCGCVVTAAQEPGRVMTLTPEALAEAMCLTNHWERWDDLPEHDKQIALAWAQRIITHLSPPARGTCHGRGEGQQT